MDENTLYAARDPYGVRPLSLGRLDRGWVVASETAALDIVGAAFVRDIEPGELLAIDADGVRSTRFANPTPKGCVFEYVYLARPDSTLAGRSVHATRVDIGRRLAREKPVDADLVIGVPESGTPAAVGYAQESGIPYGQGLMKNAYVGRTFIQPSQTIRQLGIRLKLNPLKEVIRGKRLDRRRRFDRPRQHPARADPDAPRGRRRRGARADRVTSGQVAMLLRHRLRHACRTHRQRGEQLGQRGRDARRSPSRDRRRYPLLHQQQGMIAATEQPASRLCSACFDGIYPIELPGETALGKNVIEHMLETAARTGIPLQADNDNASALRRP